MSETQKPVEEQPAPVVEQPTSAEEPATEAKAQEPVATTDETAAVTAAPTAETETAQPATEETPAPAAKEFNGEGVLGYKAPGGFMKKVLGFQKKYFWLGDDAVDTKNLSGYLNGEKHEHVCHNAAWASQTGKGLLFYSKHESEKANPVGVFNLAEVSEIVPEGNVDLSFQAYGAKHAFQCTNLTERDAWVVLLKAKAKDTVDMAEDIKSSEGYKEQYSKLNKSATPAATSSKAETKKEEKAEVKEDKTRKSRSVSRKRNSIFGNFALGSKKEEKDDKAEAKDSTAPAEAAVADEGPSEAAAPPAEEATKTGEAEPASPVETKKPAISKRNSVFGTITSRFSGRKSSSERKADATPTKDEAPVEQVSTEAPVIPAPEASESLAAAVQSPVTEETPATNGTPADESKVEESKQETKPAIKSDKRKSSLPFGLGSAKDKAEKATETEGEKPKSPFAKIRQTIRGRTSPKSKAPEKPVEEPAEDAAGEPSNTSEPSGPATEPVVSEPVPAITPSQEVSAAA